MYIYYCENCSKFDAFKSKEGNFKCPDCGGEYLPLRVTVDEWNEFSNEEMLETIKKAKTPIEIKRPDFVPEETHTKNTDSNINDDLLYETIEPKKGKKKNKKKRTKMVMLIAIATVVVIAGIGVAVFVLNIGSDKENETQGRETVSVSQQASENVSTESDKTDTEESSNKSIEPYTIDQLTEYAEKRYNELKGQGYNYMFTKDDYGTGFILSYFAGDKENKAANNVNISMSVTESYLKVDSTIQQYEPIVLNAFVEVYGSDPFSQANNWLLKGGDVVYDLADNDIEATFPNLNGTVFYSDVNAQYFDNRNYSEEKVESLRKLCDGTSFSYKIKGTFDIENKLPNDYGKNLKPLVDLYQELHNLYNGIAVE